MKEGIEIHELRVAADLNQVGELTRRLGTQLRLRGLSQASWLPVELAVVEGLNNAIKHGCGRGADDVVIVRVSWRDRQLRVEIKDTGRFTPPPGWGELPSDPLAESGRGGYLMRQAFGIVEHRNDQDGHVLVLEKNLDMVPADPLLALESHEVSLGLATDLETAYETMAGLQNFVSLLAKTHSLTDLMERAFLRLRELVGFEFAFVRADQKSCLKLLGGLGHSSALPSCLQAGDDSVELAVFGTGTFLILQGFP